MMSKSELHIIQIPVAAVGAAEQEVVFASPPAELSVTHRTALTLTD